MYGVHFCHFFIAWYFFIAWCTFSFIFQLISIKTHNRMSFDQSKKRKISISLPRLRLLSSSRHQTVILFSTFTNFRSRKKRTLKFSSLRYDSSHVSESFCLKKEAQKGGGGGVHNAVFTVHVKRMTRTMYQSYIVCIL